jgi:tRNA-2-methylthio-N6-dimethylallyladenosine synthase
VREQAENKVLSRIGQVAIRKREGSNVILGVIGCMAEREGAAMIRRYPQIDLLCGPGELDKLPHLLDNAMKTGHVEASERTALQGNRTRRSSTLGAATDDLEMLDLSRSFDPDRAMAAGRSAYVRITRGCNKFCTYCVVPYTRGAEVHRPPDTIVEECRRLADAGVIEVTLLGQTVNHYRYTHGVAVSVDGREAPQIGPGSSAFKGSGFGIRDSGVRGTVIRRASPVSATCSSAFTTRFRRFSGCASSRAFRATSTIMPCPSWPSRRASAATCTCRRSPDRTACSVS